MIRSLFTAAILSITLLSSFQAAAQQSMQEPNWSRALARSEAGRVDSRETLKHLYRLARNGSEEQLILELERIRKNGNWPVPARENLLHAFATGLGDMEAWTVSAVVIGYLQDYQPQVIVPHDDNANAGVPLYNIRAAATGAANQWRRQAAVAQAERMLQQDEYAWLQAWLDAAPPQRKAYEDALGSAGNRQIAELGNK